MRTSSTQVSLQQLPGWRHALRAMRRAGCFPTGSYKCVRLKGVRYEVPTSQGEAPRSRAFSGRTDVQTQTLFLLQSLCPFHYASLPSVTKQDILFKSKTVSQNHGQILVSSG